MNKSMYSTDIIWYDPSIKSAIEAVEAYLGVSLD